MVKKTKTAKGRLDKFYHLAKEQGYRSRAAFKLIQLNKKYNFLESAHILIDLCCAPGSWLQVASKFMPVSSVIVGVDLVPVKPIRNVTTLAEDITSAKCRSELKQLINAGTADLVLNDGAPNVGMSWTQDAYTQSELCLAALKLATEFLRKDGIFITKVFRSQDYNALMWVFNQLFGHVEATKPVASRHTSAEIFVMCSKYKAPKSVDPRFLDPKHVFKQVDLPARAPDIFAKKQARRHRDGYDESSIVLFKQCSVADFIKSDLPVPLLAANNRFTLDDEASASYASHPATTDDIRAHCSDLRVLGKREFRELLKWRLAMREHDNLIKAKAEAEGSEDGEADDDKKGEDEVEDPEEKEEELMQEMQEMEQRRLKKLKLAKKREREKKMKYQRRVDAKMVLPGDRIDENSELGVFSFSKVKAPEVLGNATPPGSDVDSDDEEAAARRDGHNEDDDADAEAVQEKYVEELDKYFDEMYEEYLEASGTRANKRKRGNAGADDMDALGSGSDDDNVQADITDLLEEGPSTVKVNLGDDEHDDGASSSGSASNEPQSQALKKAALWFSQPLFTEVQNQLMATASDDAPKPEKPVSKRTNSNKPAEASTSGDADAEKPRKATKSKASKQATKAADPDDDFEVVPTLPTPGAAAAAPLLSPPPPLRKQPRHSDSGSSTSDSDSDSDSGYDTDEKVNTLALGTVMSTSKKAREDIIDSAYNRYAFNDRDLLPKWFVEEELEHSKRQLPVTKEVVAAIRARMRAIDARPIKKVAQAKARKKMRAQKVLEKVKAKASGIADSTDISEKAKSKAISSLYKKGTASIRKGSMSMITRPGSTGRQTKVVDKRMKKDNRAQGKGGKGRKKGGRKGGAPKGRGGIGSSGKGKKGDGGGKAGGKGAGGKRQRTR